MASIHFLYLEGGMTQTLQKQVWPVSTSDVCTMNSCCLVSSTITGGLLEANLPAHFLQSTLLYLVTNTEVSFFG